MWYATAKSTVSMAICLLQLSATAKTVADVNLLLVIANDFDQS